MDRKKLYLSTTASDATVTAKKYGLGLEIAEYCTAWNLDEQFAQTDTQVRQALDGIQRRIFHAPFNELFPCAIDPRARALAAERYRQAIAVARGYGAEKVVIHGGYQPRMYYRQWYVEQSVAFWREFLREDPGVEIVLENVLEETPDMLTEILRKVDHPQLRMCLDVGHVNVYSSIPVLDWLEECGSYLDHFHVHNNDGSWDTHSALDQGTIPIRRLLTRAEEVCPWATVTLELLEADASVCWLLEE